MKFISILLCGVLAPFLTFANETSGPLEVGGLTFQLTEGWTVQPQPRPMSQGGARWKEGAASGPEVAFYHFGVGQGGDVSANLARWKGQFEGEPVVHEETRKVGDRTWHFVRIEGTFLRGRPFGPRTPVPDQRMLGAIIEDPRGTVFAKLVDDQPKVSAAVEKGFVALMESAL